MGGGRGSGGSWWDGLIVRFQNGDWAMNALSYQKSSCWWHVLGRPVMVRTHPKNIITEHHMGQSRHSIPCESSPQLNWDPWGSFWWLWSCKMIELGLHNYSWILLNVSSLCIHTSLCLSYFEANEALLISMQFHQPQQGLVVLPRNLWCSKVLDLNMTHRTLESSSLCYLWKNTFFLAFFRPFFEVW